MRSGVVGAIIFGLAGVAVLIGLGAWQLKRLAWKEALIARLEQRLAAEPVALPMRPDPAWDAFLRVRVSGHIEGPELHVLTSLIPYGPGFRVVVALKADSGRIVMADFGYVPEALKDAGNWPTGPVEVVGALYWPDETDGFTPAPDPEANIWFARDLGPMAAALGAEPLLIIADSGSLGGGEWPKPLRLGVSLVNNHLQYAITWFLLALAWAVMSALLVRRERGRPGGG
ncbi:MAG: SURF1 family protein [Alphaproteobacteria bacterium]